MKLVLTIIAVMSFHAMAQEITPTVAVSQSLSFTDDMDFEGLETAIDRQLLVAGYDNLTGKIKFGSKTYPKTVLRDSLVLLKSLTGEAKECLKSGNKEACLMSFNQAMNSRFAIYRPTPKKGEMGYRKPKTTQFTSYYSPDLSGSRVKTERFKRAIYRLPENATERNMTRVQIDFKGALDGKGHELFYVEDSFFDLYLLHVQGGGRIKIHNEDGTTDVRYLSFAGKNTRTFQMVYHDMKSKGYLKGDSSVDAQREFLAKNPHKEEEVFASCPSYVFFKESLEEPVGVDNIPLTPGRSLAIDVRTYKSSGLINFVKTVRPSGTITEGRVDKIGFARFFIAQDTGGAIRGNARADLYAGYGHEAELAAYNTNELGEQYFLIKK